MESISTPPPGGRKVPPTPKFKPTECRLPPKNLWPDYPLLVRFSQDVPSARITNPLTGADLDLRAPLPVNDPTQPIAFETDLFKGLAFFRIADLPPHPNFPGKDARGGTNPIATDYFKGKRRKLQGCIQGKFKRPLRFDQVYSGQEFSRTLRHVPAKRLVKWAFGVVRSRLPEVAYADLFGPLPYFLNPLITGSKVVRADRGAPPHITSLDIRENMKDVHGLATFYYPGEEEEEKKRAPFLAAAAAAAAVAACKVVDVDTDDVGGGSDDGGESEEGVKSIGSRRPSSSSTVSTLSSSSSSSTENPTVSASSSFSSLGSGGGGVQSATKASEVKAKARQHRREAKATQRAWGKANDSAVKVRLGAFGTVKALESQTFDPDVTYTFDYFDSFFRADSFSLDLGVKKVDVCHMVGEQPLQIDMAKDIGTGEYLWKFEMWHAKTLRDDSPLFAANTHPGPVVDAAAAAAGTDATAASADNLPLPPRSNV